ncbi:membrane protein insertase YidC [Arsenicicoccus sp. oral taxon 190]|uniref:membrane protein insertase YidC n=1 Tax=Arsenicicoccus sp. oral taxon 190 TaxID=1658671 RepID=UPI000679F459|nr:membrane protein insertase YidC [Arsenicicoccus sp. oral taxon 190]AKT50856.1 preprotein translocase subunit YidC [Arsenicicoccus sp. oral taxon 190]
MDFLSTLLRPIEIAVAWIMYGFHQLFTTIGMDPEGGLTWGLSIVGLVVVIRILITPLFIKQLHASRKMTLIQPELQKIQAKYKGKTDPESRQKMTEETMALYKESGTNPFSSCMPILLQMPIFFALFNVLNGLGAIAKGTRDAVGPITAAVAHQAEASTFWGVQLSDKFVGSEDLNAKVITIVLIVLMSITQFTSQHQAMTKNMPASAMDNPMFKQQRILLYVMPVVFAVSGINFPIGVLIYWLVTNLWSMGQQFYTIGRMPTPGSPAYERLEAKRKAQGKAMPGAHSLKRSDAGQATVEGEVVESPVRQSGQRQQPKRKGRKGSGRGPGGSTSGGSTSGGSTSGGPASGGSSSARG